MRPKHEEWAEIPPERLRDVQFFDSHVHLSDYSDPAVVVGARATRTLLMAQGIDKDSSLRTLALAKANQDLVKSFVGVHPSEALKNPDFEWVTQALGEATGLGEVGLDPKYSETVPGGAQVRVFEAQLTAAEAARKPVQVHTRDAERSCLEIASRYRLRGVLLHWFQGEDLMPRVLDLGYYVSFGPALLYSKRLQRIASSVERSFVLSESDGPVPFAPLGGSQGPSLIPSVVFKLSEIWRVRFEEAEQSIAENVANYLSVEKG